MIERAAELLRAGELVAFPTETVYGLGADATNPAAVAKIFAAKGRPAHNPLIAHVASIEVARRYAAEWPAAAQRLAERFWPGPLTVVVRRTAAIADNVAAGGSTVGLRVPDHPAALALLRAFNGPVAGPSANRSNYVSPTSAAHVRGEFGDAVTVLDGGPCRVGIESTVVDVTGERPRVLRPGAITQEMIDAVLLPLPLKEGVGERVQGNATRSISVDSPGKTSADEVGSQLHSPSGPLPPPPPSGGGGEEIRSPGQLPVHYAPRTPAYRFDPAQRSCLDLVDAAIIELTLDPDTYARNLYARLRLLDTQGLRAIYIELPPDTAQWRAVRDRVLRATKPLESEGR